jgi:hypothetical protein
MCCRAYGCILIIHTWSEEHQFESYESHAPCHGKGPTRLSSTSRREDTQAKLAGEGCLHDTSWGSLEEQRRKTGLLGQHFC